LASAANSAGQRGGDRSSVNKRGRAS
jgi:hypothetical protein